MNTEHIKDKATLTAQSTGQASASSDQPTGKKGGSPSRLGESAMNKEHVKDRNEALEVVVDVKAFNEAIGQRTSAKTIDNYGRQSSKNNLRGKFRFGSNIPNTPERSSSSTQRFDIFTPNRVYDNKIIGFSSTLDEPDFFPSPPSSPPPLPSRQPCALATFLRARL